MVTKRSPNSHQKVTKWSPIGHFVVIKWSPGGQKVVKKIFYSQPDRKGRHPPPPHSPLTVSFSCFFLGVEKTGVFGAKHCFKPFVVYSYWVKTFAFFMVRAEGADPPQPD